MSMKVQFHQIDAFLEERTQEREAVTDRILRVTYLHAQPSDMPIVQLSVVAGVLVRGVLMEFVQRCGDLWMRRSDRDAKTTQRAQDLLLRLEEAANRLDLQAVACHRTRMPPTGVAAIIWWTASRPGAPASQAGAYT